MDNCGWFCPINFTHFLIQLRRMVARLRFILAFYGNSTIGYGFYGFNYQVGTPMHQFLIKRSQIVFLKNGFLLLKNYIACIDLMFKEERCNSGFFFAIDDSPVDGGSATVIRQKGGMEIKCTQRRHVPHYFRQHSKSHHDLYIGLITFKFFYKFGRFEVAGLQYRDTMPDCGLFDRWSNQFSAPALRFVGGGDNSHDIPALLYQQIQGWNSKLGGTH